MFCSSRRRYFSVFCLLMSRKLTWMFWEEGVLLGYLCSLLSSSKITGCSLIHISYVFNWRWNRITVNTHWVLKGPSIAVKHFACSWKEHILHLESNVQNLDYYVCTLSLWFILLIGNNKCCLDQLFFFFFPTENSSSVLKRISDFRIASSCRTFSCFLSC